MLCPVANILWTLSLSLLEVQIFIHGVEPNAAWLLVPGLFHCKQCHPGSFISSHVTGHPFSRLNDIPLHREIILSLFIQPLVDVWSTLLAVVNNARLNMGVSMTSSTCRFCLLLDVHMTGIAGSYGSSSFNFLRNLYAGFYHGWINLHSYQQHARLPCCHILSTKPIFKINLRW